MANIRINSLPPTTSVLADDVLPMDGATTRKIKPSDLVTSVRPFATQAEAEAGVNATASMNPLNTAQAIDARLPNTAAGRGILAAADDVAQRGLLGLGTAATLNTGPAAGNVVVLDGSARLPAVDGSQLTGISGALTDGDKGDVTVSMAGSLWSIATLTGDSGSGGARGLVPAPAAGDAADDKFLNADGDWKAVSGTLTTSGDYKVASSADHQALRLGDVTVAKNEYRNTTHSITNRDGSELYLTIDEDGSIFQSEDSSFGKGGHYIGRNDGTPWFDTHNGKLFEVYADSSEQVILQDTILRIMGHTDTGTARDSGAGRFLMYAGEDGTPENTGPVYSRAFEAHVIIGNEQTGPQKSKVMEVGLHSRVAEVNGDDLVGIMLFNSASGKHGPWFPDGEGERAGVGLLIEGDLGWYYPIKCSDTDNTTPLFAVDQNGLVYAKSGYSGIAAESSGVVVDVRGRSADQLGIFRMLSADASVERGRLSFGASGMVLSTTEATPLYLGTGNTPKFQIDATGNMISQLAGNVMLGANGHLFLRGYGVTGLPTASGNAGSLIYVFDGASNKRLAVCDGTNWRWPDGSVVS